MRCERDIKRPILEALEILPRVVWVARCQSGRVRVRGGWMHLAPEGSPDLVGGLKVGGRVDLFGVEVKTAKGPMRERQIEMRARWERAGALYVVARSVDEAIQGLLGAEMGR